MGSAVHRRQVGRAVHVGRHRGALARDRRAGRQGAARRARRRRRRLCGRPQGLRRGTVAEDDADRARRDPRSRGQDPRGAGRRAEVPAGRRDRSAADHRRHDAVRRGDVVVQLLRGRRGQVHLAGNPRRHLRPDLGAQGADRCRRRGHRLERAVLPGGQQARPRSARRLHRGAQAGRRDPPVGVRDGSDVRRGRATRRRAVDRARRPVSGPPRSSSRARWNSAASRPRSSSKTPTWTRRCRCWCSRG